MKGIILGVLLALPVHAEHVCPVCSKDGESEYAAPIPERVDGLPDAAIDCCPCCGITDDDINAL